MNEKQIVFIICADNAQYYNECVWYIEHLVIPEGYSIDVLCIQEVKSMAEGYNAGMQASNAKYKVYLRQEAFILNPNFIGDVLDIFQSDSSIGLIGMQGTQIANADDQGEWNLGGIYLFDGKSTEVCCIGENGGNKFSYAQTIIPDVFVTQYDIEFVDDNDNWDLNGMVHSQRVQDSGYKVVIPNQTKPWCYIEKCVENSQPVWDDMKDKMIGLISSGRYDGMFSVMWEMQEANPTHFVIREIINILEMYYLESDSVSGVHSEFFDGRPFGEMYEYYKWIAFLLRRIDLGYVDDEVQVLKEKVNVQVITVTVIQKIADIYLEDCTKVYNYLFGNCEEPLVSVIVPVYNGQDFVGKTIDSILNQTYQNLELIIIDDASKDKSKEVINSFADSRIKTVFQEENHNVCYSGNVGFQLAKGKYVALIGHDDIWKMDKLRKQISFLEEHPVYDVCFTWCDIIDEEEKIVSKVYPGLYKRFCSNNLSNEQWLKKMLINGNSFCAPSACIRKTALDKSGYYRLALLQLQDYELWLRIFQNGKVYIINNKAVNYRRFTETGQNISATSPENRNRDAHELQWIFDTHVWNMDNKKFIKVFAKDLKDRTVKNDKEILCEKAILIWESHNCYAAVHFIELFEDEECRKILEIKYNLRLADFYKMNAKPRLYDSELLYTIRELENELKKYREKEMK